MKNKRVQFSDTLQYVEEHQEYQEKTRFEKEGTLFPPFEFQGTLDYISRGRWGLLYDPTPSGASTRQQASVVAQQMLAKPSVSTVCLMD